MLSRVPFTLLVPSVALILLALSRPHDEQPPPAEPAALTWRTLHRHSGEARGFNGLGMVIARVRREGASIYGMSWGQLLRSEDGGASWTEPSEPRNAVDAAFGAHGLVLVSTQDRGKVSRSTDGGRTWRQIQTVADIPITTIALAGDVAFGLGFEFLLRSTDAGESWSRIDVPKVDFNDVTIRGRTVLVVGGAGLVMRSLDGGATWQTQWLPTHATLNAVAFADDSTVVIAGSGGTLLRSTDVGASWVPVASPTRVHLHGVAFTQDGQGLAVGQWGEAIRSTDRGGTWQRERSGTRLHLMRVEAGPAGDFLVSGSREAIFSVAGGGPR